MVHYLQGIVPEHLYQNPLAAPGHLLVSRRAKTSLRPNGQGDRRLLSAGKGRGITIHTMGFVGADLAMMQAVADRTGGRYSDIE